MKNHSNFDWPRRVGAMLLVAGTLLAGELAASASLLAAPMQVAQAQAEQSISPRTNRSARSVQRAVQRDLAEFLNLHRRDVQIVSIEPQTWPDGCLGLGRPEEGCLAALVEGWRVTAQANRQTWVYRTDATGATLRREDNSPPSTPNAELPPAVRNRVLQTLSEQFNVSAGVVVAAAERRTWDGCLGISEPGVMCSMIAISGWRVTVVDTTTRPDDRFWVYHTNADGSEVRLNPAASSIGGTISPIQILPENLPQSLEQNVVFRSIANGGMLPRQTTTTLYEDGRVVVQQINSGRQSQRSYRVSRQQVEQFRRLLNQQQFDRFDRLDFSAPYGAADYITVMLVSQNGVTQYADAVENRLPSALQQVIARWNQDVVQAQ